MGLFLPGVIGHRWLEGHRRSVLWSLRVTLRHLSSPPSTCSWQARPSFAQFRAPVQALLGLRKSGREARWRPWGGGRRGEGGDPVWGAHAHKQLLERPQDLGRLLQVMSQSSIFLYTLAMVHWYIQFLSYTYEWHSSQGDHIADAQ